MFNKQTLTILAKNFASWHCLKGNSHKENLKLSMRRLLITHCWSTIWRHIKHLAADINIMWFSSFKFHFKIYFSQQVFKLVKSKTAFFYFYTQIDLRSASPWCAWLTKIIGPFTFFKQFCKYVKKVETEFSIVYLEDISKLTRYRCESKL